MLKMLVVISDSHLHCNWVFLIINFLPPNRFNHLRPSLRAAPPAPIPHFSIARFTIDHPGGNVKCWTVKPQMKRHLIKTMPSLGNPAAFRHTRAGPNLLHPAAPP